MGCVYILIYNNKMSNYPAKHLEPSLCTPHTCLLFILLPSSTPTSPQEYLFLQMLCYPFLCFSWGFYFLT